VRRFVGSHSMPIPNVEPGVMTFIV